MFATFRASSWEEVKQHFGDLSLWAFRGQSNDAWPLETALYREASLRYDMPKDKWLKSRESWMLYQFSRFAHQFKHDLPKEENKLDWLALIQHYGGPTRLLDFTYSLHIASFFAVESSTTDAAVWAINLSTLAEANHELLDFHPEGRIDETRRAHNSKFEELLLQTNETLAAIHVEPDKMHERLWTQQGLFLAPTNPNEPFMANLASTFGIDPNTLGEIIESKWTSKLNNRSSFEYGKEGYIAVVKIIIPKEFHRDILKDLRRVNITAATLFPGLEGFARSLKYHI
jgi:hypothetical protein